MTNLKKLEKLWINLKKAAPKVFRLYAQRKIYKLERELKKLRQEYRSAETKEEKEKIKNLGTSVKLELELIKRLIEEKEKKELDKM